jgi:hypothetical protein
MNIFGFNTWQAELVKPENVKFQKPYMFLEHMLSTFLLSSMYLAKTGLNLEKILIFQEFHLNNPKSSVSKIKPIFLVFSIIFFLNF